MIEQSNFLIVESKTNKSFSFWDYVAVHDFGQVAAWNGNARNESAVYGNT